MINESKTKIITCDCITAIIDWGAIEVVSTNAFQMATKLTSVTIPESVKSIKSGAFRLDEGYTRTVIMQASIPPTLEPFSADIIRYAFDAVGTNNIIVPTGCAATYKAAEGWRTYADYITEAS